jgi:multidrug resistance efflux pump
MKAMFRPPRVFWVLGVLLLVVTAAGASWVLNHSSASDNSDKNREPIEPFSSIGFVDVEGGITMLHPPIKGEVAHIWVRENEEVWEGYLLLSLNSDLARDDLRAANLALELAKNQLAIAERARKQHKELLAAKRAAVDAKKALRDIAQEEFNKAEKFFNENQINKFDRNIAENNLKAVQEALKAEEHLLKELELKEPELETTSAELQVQAKEILRDKARHVYLKHDVYAPTDGTMLRVLANVGETISDQPKQPALQFCPNTPRIVRAEVLQEWAPYVKKGQSAVIEDDTRAGPHWQGTVKSVSDWFTHRRAILLEPFQFNDVRTLECIVSVESGSRPLRIGQRVRVTFK